MEDSKKLGTITMALYAILALASFVFSTSGCYPGSTNDESSVKWFLYCLRVVVYEDIPGNEFSDHIYLPTKYLLLLCATLFSIGALWYRGALTIPAKLKALVSFPEQAAPPHDKGL